MLAHGGDLSVHGGDLSAHGGDLSAHGGDLSAHEGDLSAHGGDLSAHGGDLSPHGGDLSAASARAARNLSNLSLVIPSDCSMSSVKDGLSIQYYGSPSNWIHVILQ